MRRGNGQISLMVTVDEIPSTEKLIQAEFLRPEDCDNRAALTAAVETVIRLWARGPARRMRGVAWL